MRVEEDVAAYLLRSLRCLSGAESAFGISVKYDTSSHIIQWLNTGGAVFP